MTYWGQPRSCDECGARLSNRYGARFCSTACKQAAYRRRRANLEGRNYMPTHRPPTPHKDEPKDPEP